jgi:DnaJ-class molecular chaperone
MKPCPVCSGTGYEYVWRSSPASVIRCTECQGEGKLPVEQEEVA